MNSERQNRKNEIQTGLSIIQPSMPYPKSNNNEGVLTQLVCHLLEEGNGAFREEQWNKAIQNFTEGVNVAQYAQSKDLGIPPALLESLYVNRASTYHCMEEYERCIKDCDHALAVCEGSRRALYRKALCLKQLGRYREAYDCSLGCLLTASNDKQANELAQELANKLGMKGRKPYISSKEPAAAGGDSNGTTGPCVDEMSANGDQARIPVCDGDTFISAAGSVDSPGQGPQGLLQSEHEAPGDFDLIGEDLDTLLDGFSKEQEAPEASLPSEPSMFTSSPVQAYGRALPAPSPQLPPAFFTSGVSQLNSLDTFCPEEHPSTALTSLQSLDGLEALDHFPACGGGGDSGGLQPSLNALMDMDSLDVFEAPPRAAPGDELSDLDLEGLDFLNASDSIPVLGDGNLPEMAVYPLNMPDSLDSLDTFPPLVGASAPTLVSKAVGRGRLGSPTEFTLSGGGRSFSAPPTSRSTKSNYMNHHGGSVVSRLCKHPLSSTHLFLQACSSCYTSTGPGIFDVQHQPDMVHDCRRDLLLCRNRAESLWMRVRERPKNQVFGPYVLCKEILQSGLKKGCKYGEACMFAFCQQEIDVWTQERKGTLRRDLLFSTPDNSPGSVPSIKQLLQLYNGMFLFLCTTCYDSKPRIISKRSEEAPDVCSNLSARHPFDRNKCLVHVVRTSSVKYSKIRPLHDLCHYDVCRHAIRYGCQREGACLFAHSVIELKLWMLQRDTGITPEEIVLESTKHWQKLEQNTHKQRGNKHVKVQTIGGTGGGGAGGGGRKGLPMRMKFVCGQCWKDGLVSEPDKALKYCTAKGRHSLTKERRVLLAMSLGRKKWAMVRPLPHGKIYPQQYEICSHIAKQRKCTFTGNCTYAHSLDEKEVWTYMKNHNLKDLQQMHDTWMSLTGQDRQPDGACLSQPPNANSEDKYIVMPTDLAEPMNGFHCRLCGRHSNSERQWQQHISSEKHKDRVFSYEGEDEDEGLAWAYRFPGPCFTLCPRLERGCEEGVSCDYAHSEEELAEWKERRDFLRRKLAKAREDMLIMPNEFDFGKYNFLLQG